MSTKPPEPERPTQEEQPPESGRRPAKSEPLPPMPSSRGKHREAWVGLFVIVGVLVAFVLLFTFTDSSMFRGRYTVTAIVNQAGGIRHGDPVQLRGVNIGRVKDFRISPQGVSVRLEIEGRYHFPADSTVNINSSGLIGGMVAEIEPGTSPKELPAGGVMHGTAEQGTFQAVGNLADQAETVLNRIQGLLSEQTVQNVQGSTADLQTTLQQLSATIAEQRAQLNALTTSLRRSASNLEQVTGKNELQLTIKQLDKVLADVDQSSQSLDTVTGRIARGEGTLGRLSKEDALYVNANQAMLSLNQTAAEVRRLAQDIRLHPKRYINVSVF